MDSNEPNQSPFISAHLPLTLIAGAAIFFFASQLGSIKQGIDSMKWQSENADKGIKSLEEAKKSLDATVTNSERVQLVAQSEQLQKQFTNLMKELDELARGGDKDAEMIIKGYGIKVNDAPAASTPSTPVTPASPAPAADKPAGNP